MFKYSKVLKMGNKKKNQIIKTLNSYIFLFMEFSLLIKLS